MDGFEFENCGNAVLKCEEKFSAALKRQPVQERTFHGNQGIFQ